MRIIAITAVVLALTITAALLFLQTEEIEQTQISASNRSPEQQAGTRYQPVGSQFTPVLREISPPVIQGANSIWGATGRDDKGHIWLGVSGSGKDRSTSGGI